MGFIMLKSSQAQITQLKNNLIVISAAYKSYVKSSEFKHRSTAAQPSPIGCSSSSKYKNIGGFWHPNITELQQSNTYFLIVAGGGKNPQNLLWITTEFLSNRFYRML